MNKMTIDKDDIIGQLKYNEDIPLDTECCSYLINLVELDKKIDRETVIELIVFKVKHFKETIDSILKKWNESNSYDFISKAKTGEIEDAEMDAITIKQLVADSNKLQSLLDSIIKDGE